MKPLSSVSTRLTPATLTQALQGFIGLVCLSLILATAWQVNQSRHERIATAEIAVSNIVRAAEQQAQDTMRQADNALRDLAERVEYDGTYGEQKVRLVKLMAQTVMNTKGIQGLFIYDAQGNWVANSFSQNPQMKNNGDRDYFIYHKENVDESIHIGSIVVSRTTGDMVIPISRRISSTDGRFAGVVLATVPVAYFQDFFECMDVDDKGVIFLARDNGDLLARRPTVTALMTTNISKGDIFSRYLPYGGTGTAIITSVVDGVERLYSYRRLSGLPIVAAAGISSQSVFAPWWAYVYRSLGVIGAIILILVFLSSLLYRQIKQLIAAEQQLNNARNELEIISLTDSLTQLANRRCFDQAIKKEWGRAQRSCTTVAIILLDIDWFKQFNDYYGHLRGDNCLKQIARLIDSSVNRAGDLAARFGGEEFVVLLPGTDLSGAMSIAEKIRSAIEQAGIEHLASRIGHVAISAGVVAINASDKQGCDTALAEADKLLYFAKAQGRNCIEGRFIADEQSSAKKLHAT